MAKLIGTAGHVDHGKTSLIRALTGIDADRLPEEKKRGMTIDIGFAYLDLPEVGRASIVDVPGHERFIHNMLVGALGIDVALLCVAADEGAMPQTQEHLEILSLLPVDRMVVAMTKCDMADADLREIVSDDIRTALKDTRFAQSPIIPVSSVTAEGLEALRQELVIQLKAATERADGPWYMPVDRVFSVKGHGTVVTGTLVQGTVGLGERAVLQPGGEEVRVRALHSHEEPLEKAERGRRTAVNLGGVKTENIHRGMILGASGAVFETQILDAKVHWIREVKHGMRIRLSIGAEEAIGKVFLADNEPELAQFRLEKLIACALNQPLIVRRYSPMTVLGGGKVSVPQAKVRRKSEAVAKLGEGLSLEDSVIAAVSAHPNGTPTEEVARQLGQSLQALGSVFEKLLQEGRLVGFAGLWLTAQGFQSASDRFMLSLKNFHETNPSTRIHPREKVVEQAGLKWQGKPLDRILATLVQEGRIIVEGTGVRAADFSVQLSPKQRTLLDRAVAELEKGGGNVPAPLDIARALAVPPQAVEEILRLGIEAKEVVRIEEGIFYSATQIQGFKQRLEKEMAGRGFSAAEFRDLIGSSRKYVIPLLEYLDANRFTMRQGDLRVLVKR